MEPGGQQRGLHQEPEQGFVLKGLKIGFLYPDYAFGQEPIPVLKTLAAKEGFELVLFPNPLPGRDQGRCGRRSAAPTPTG